MKKKTPAQANGFTLIELLIYMAIISIVVFSFISFAQSMTVARNKIYVVQEVETNMRAGIDLIARKTREAREVILPVEGDAGSSLILGTADPEVNINFSLDNGVIYITEGGQERVAITSNEVNVTNLLFTDIANAGERESVKIIMEAKYNGTESVDFKYQDSMETAVSIRR